TKRRSSSAAAPEPSMTAAITADMTTPAAASLAAVDRAIGTFRDVPAREGVDRPAEAARERQLDGEPQRVQTESEAEHVDLQPLLDACQEAEHAPGAELDPGAARRPREEAFAEIILADGRRRQIRFELRHVAEDVRDERVGVGTGPDPVNAGEGVAFDGRL